MSRTNDPLFASLLDAIEVNKEAAASLSRALAIKTVRGLAESPHFTFAAEIVAAAANPRHPMHRFGIPRGRIAKALAKAPLEELPDAPLSALEGISKPAEQQLTKALRIKTIRELAQWPPFLRARAVFKEAVRAGTAVRETEIFRVSGLVLRQDRSPVVGAKVKIMRQASARPFRSERPWGLASILNNLQVR